VGLGLSWAYLSPNLINRSLKMSFEEDNVTKRYLTAKTGGIMGSLDIDDSRPEPPAPRLTSVTKDKLAYKARELEAKIKDGMPSYSDMQIPSNENVDKQIAWKLRTGNAIQELRSIYKKIDPENKRLQNIERLRDRS
jgi:hypothetical protein